MNPRHVAKSTGGVEMQNWPIGRHRRPGFGQTRPCNYCSTVYILTAHASVRHNQATTLWLGMIDLLNELKVCSAAAYGGSDSSCVSAVLGLRDDGTGGNILKVVSALVVVRRTLEWEP